MKNVARYVGGGYICSDKAGNVWLTSDRDLIELNHGGDVVSSLPDEGYNDTPWACSVDPTTGNVAAINSDNGDLIVWANASGSGTAFQTSLGTGYSCAYDDRGNLFGYGINRQFVGQLVELPKGGTYVGIISVNQRLPGNESIQWDGRDLAVQIGATDDHTTTLDRLRVSGSNARVVSTVRLVSPRRVPVNVPQFWIQGSTIMESTGLDAREVALWKYPEGGKPKRLIERSGGSHPYYINGITVSVAPK